MSEGVGWKHLAVIVALVGGWYAATNYKPKEEVKEKAGLSREYAYKICEQVCIQESMIVVDALRNKKFFADVETYDAIKSLPAIGCQRECWNRIQP